MIRQSDVILLSITKMQISQLIFTGENQPSEEQISEHGKCMMSKKKKVTARHNQCLKRPHIHSNMLLPNETAEA